MLAAMQDDKFVVWYHPAVIYTDKDLLPLTRIIKEGRLELSNISLSLHWTPSPVADYSDYIIVNCTIARG